MISTKRSVIKRMLAGAATAAVAFGLLGAAAPVALAADHDQDNWWYNNDHKNWQGNNNWHDNSDGWRYGNNRNYYSSYRYSGGRPYYYAPPPVYYYTPPPADAYPPAHVGPPSLTFGFTF